MHKCKIGFSYSKLINRNISQRIDETHISKKIYKRFFSINKMNITQNKNQIKHIEMKKIKNNLPIYTNISKSFYTIDYKKANDFLIKNKQDIFPKKITHFINGEFYESHATSQSSYESISVVNPTTEEIIATFNEAIQDEIDISVKAAESAFLEWNSIPLDIRVKLFMQLADKLETNILEFSILESIDNGKVLRDACEDIKEVIRLIRYYGGFIDKIFGSTISAIDDFTIQTRRVPFGIVGCISPWNYPLLMATWKIIPALCAGNSVILKPSEEAPLSILKFCEIFKEIGFPKGFLNVVLGRGPQTGSLISRNNKISKVSFTGSTFAAKQVMLGATDSNLKSVQLELGGKSPLIIFDDADLENASTWIVNGAFFNTSQNCICSSRLLIHENIYEELIKMIVSKTKNLKVGKFNDSTADLGPLINKKQYANYFKYMKIGNQEGLQLIYGGKDLKKTFEKGYFVDPAIFINVPDNSLLAKEEIFAPILSILTPFKTTDEAIKRANDSIYGLAAGVFSRDLNKIEYFVRNIQSGNVHVNCYNLSPYNVPFGGMKQSGFGRDCGMDGIIEFTQTKSVYYFTELNKI